MSFLTKIGEFITGGNPIEKIAGVVDRFTETKDEKHELFKEIYKLDAEERANARALYGKDNSLHKVYAIVFLIGYISLTGMLIYSIMTGQIKEVNQFETGMIGTIWGGMSSKVNTVVDFLFGASDKLNK